MDMLEDTQNPAPEMQNIAWLIKHSNERLMANIEHLNTKVSLMHPDPHLNNTKVNKLGNSNTLLNNTILTLETKIRNLIIPNTASAKKPITTTGINKAGNSYATAAAVPPGRTTLSAKQTNRQPKPEMLFNTEYTKIDREIIWELAIPILESITLAATLLAINKQLEPHTCIISVGKTGKDKIIMLTKPFESGTQFITQYHN